MLILSQKEKGATSMSVDAEIVVSGVITGMGVTDGESKQESPTLSCAGAARAAPMLNTIISKHLFTMRLFRGFISDSIELFAKVRRKSESHVLSGRKLTKNRINTTFCGLFRMSRHADSYL
jgi:hypothetical protein